jgi:hypothetical protein
MAYFCEQQIDILQIISKNTRSTKNKKASQSQQITFPKSSRTQLFRTADKDRLRRCILKLLDSRGATLNAPLEEF